MTARVLTQRDLIVVDGAVNRHVALRQRSHSAPSPFERLSRDARGELRDEAERLAAFHA